MCLTKMKANNSLYFYPSSVINELNTEQDVEHVAIHCVSKEGEGVPGLQLLVDSPPTSGLHRAFLATVYQVPGLVFCLAHPPSIVV